METIVGEPLQAPGPRPAPKCGNSSAGGPEGRNKGEDNGQHTAIYYYWMYLVFNHDSVVRQGSAANFMRERAGNDLGQEYI